MSLELQIVLGCVSKWPHFRWIQIKQRVLSCFAKIVIVMIGWHSIYAQ